MLVALAVAIPFLLLSAGIVWQLADNERENRRDAILYSTRTLLNGVDSADPVALEARLALVDLPNEGAPTDYWLGGRNFYVITRYNRSSFYAMSVIELAEALRAARDARGG